MFRCRLLLASKTSLIHSLVGSDVWITCLSEVVCPVCVCQFGLVPLLSLLEIRDAAFCSFQLKPVGFISAFDSLNILYVYLQFCKQGQLLLHPGLLMRNSGRQRSSSQC
jgi:hypothetical protein